MENYGLIIIDDEEMMRDGLSSFIKWEEEGFHLDGVFEDGRDAIEWLGENDTHVILTDLRMTHKSGLNVASFVRDKGLNIKIVIISGYSDFEAAREAMGYKVSDYLLKPISVKKIKETFHRLKGELDKEYRGRQIISDEIARYDSLVSYVEESFISNLVLGALRRPEQLEQQLELINWDKSIMDQPCIIFTLSMLQNNRVSNEYDSIERNNLIGGMISRRFPHPRFYWYHTSLNEISGIIFSCGDFDGLKERVTTFLQEISKQVYAFSLCFQVRHIQPYENLKALAQRRESHTAGEGGLYDHKVWEEKRRLILSHILENQEDLALEMLSSYMEALYDIGWAQLINGLIELFHQINHTFNKKQQKKTDLISFADFFSLRNRSEIYEWTKERINEVTCFVQNDAVSNQISLILRAKEYIETNYAEDVMLTQVAEYVNLSSVYLSRLFKEQTGVNFSEYLSECRIKRACELLKSTNHKIYEICEEVGYSDVKHFYGVFKKRMECTPSEYRHDQ